MDKIDPGIWKLLIIAIIAATLFVAFVVVNACVQCNKRMAVPRNEKICIKPSDLV